MCDVCDCSASTKASYSQGIPFAISTLSTACPAASLYLDAAHGGWLGWDNNLESYAYPRPNDDNDDDAVVVAVVVAVAIHAIFVAVVGIVVVAFFFLNFSVCRGKLFVLSWKTT